MRQVLRQVGIADRDLLYDENGKPSLRLNGYISISHSFDYALVALSNKNIGIDIELKREKVKRLKEKFCNSMELALTPNDNAEQLDYLTEVWSVKEALYKMCNSRSLSFAQDMAVDVKEKQATIAQGNFSASFAYHTFRLDEYVIVVSSGKRTE